ncbi:hypothetical protein OUZ56_005687 [Daphnia magna]|uniref:Uncharacterized protein n=1 Tax=Daphnia magna TaxID=35525 RepID=A0ABQ9YTR4_9CRUS|nr:hypothetical protein OUZ56_005687 [Daphnia magna]
MNILAAIARNHHETSLRAVAMIDILLSEKSLKSVRVEPPFSDNPVECMTSHASSCCDPVCTGYCTECSHPKSTQVSKRSGKKVQFLSDLGRCWSANGTYKIDALKKWIALRLEQLFHGAIAPMRKSAAFRNRHKQGLLNA